MSLGGLQKFLDSIGQPGIYASPHDFTAAYASANTLTLTGLPVGPVIWVGVLEIAVSGRYRWYPGRDYFFTFVPATGVLTVSTASADGVGFTNTSAFIVIFAEQEKAYDSVLNAIQTAELTAQQQDWIDAQVVINAHDLDQSAPADSGWINTKGQTFMRLFYDWTSGVGAGVHNLLVTMEGNPTDAGATEYLELGGPSGTSVNGAEEPWDASELVEVTGYDRVKIYIDEDGGTGKGTITLTVTMMNR